MVHYCLSTFYFVCLETLLWNPCMLIWLSTTGQANSSVWVMFQAWGASRSAVLSGVREFFAECVSSASAAVVSYQAQFIGCFKHTEVAVLNSFFFGGWPLFLPVHLPTFFVLVYTSNVQLFRWFISVCDNYWTKCCINWPAFGKGKIMLLLREAAQMFFMSIQKRGDCTLLSNWRKPCIWKSLVCFMGYMMRLWTWKSRICD